MNERDKNHCDDVKNMPDDQASANAEADTDNPPTDAGFWEHVDIQEPDDCKTLQNKRR